jgi:hypothetical protein
MKNTFAILLCLVFALGVQAQEEQRVDISNFEDEQDWSYQGGNISTSSVIPEPLETGVNAQEGSHALMVQYDNYIEGPWAWAQLNFPDGPRDLSGLTELHMWVYFSDDSAGPIEIQLTLSDASTGKDYNLGTQAATDYAQWSELVWQIDPVTSPKLTNITHFGGFIAPAQRMLLVPSILTMSMPSVLPVCRNWREWLYTVSRKRTRLSITSQQDGNVR